MRRSVAGDFHISRFAERNLRATPGLCKGTRKREEEGRERERAANWRYYVGSFRRESIWQIGQSLRGQNFSSGCDDGVERTRLPPEGVVSGCTRTVEGETV